MKNNFKRITWTLVGAILFLMSICPISAMATDIVPETEISIEISTDATEKYVILDGSYIGKRQYDEILDEATSSGYGVCFNEECAFMFNTDLSDPLLGDPMFLSYEDDVLEAYFYNDKIYFSLMDFCSMISGYEVWQDAWVSAEMLSSTLDNKSFLIYGEFPNICYQLVAIPENRLFVNGEHVFTPGNMPGIQNSGESFSIPLVPLAEHLGYTVFETADGWVVENDSKHITFSYGFDFHVNENDRDIVFRDNVERENCDEPMIGLMGMLFAFDLLPDFGYGMTNFENYITENEMMGYDYHFILTH